MNRLRSLLVVFCIIFSTTIFAQLGTSSPYSHFGLGDLQGNVLPEYNALGGGVTAISSQNSVNYTNPATYTSFNPKSFLFSTGGWHQTTEMQNLIESQTVNNNAFSHLILGFPINKKLAASAGITPFSSMGYAISTRALEHNADMDYYGDGGISKIYFGGAYKPLKGFSVGINASYLFGSLNRRKQLIYDDESFFHTRATSKINLKGYYYELGLLYEKLLAEDNKISFGLTANNNSSIRANRSDIVESFEVTEFFESPKDTFSNSNEWGDAVLPQCISTGISYREGKQWLLVAEYRMQNWENYSLFDESDNLNNSIRISGGIQYTPEFNSITKYYKRMQYRLGGGYSNMPIALNDKQLKEISVNFGFGIPVRKSRTKYDLSFILGQRGTTDNNLIKEQFLRIGLSVSYDGIWFVKRKYD